MVTLRTPVTLTGRDLTTVARVRRGCRRDRAVRDDAWPVAPAAAGSDRSNGSARGHGGVLERVDGAQPVDGASGRTPSMRSLITLKALTYAPTGGIVAAPTTSLPELLGGPRNWDYRFCWLRDATLTLLALMNAGYYAEAQAWRDWLLRAAAGSPSQLQIMYGIGGERRLTESELDWLPGYEQSRPVRIGNAAHEQLQLDVYGEVMDALHQARTRRPRRVRHAMGLPAQRARAPRDHLAAARSRDVGGARRAPAVHVLEGHGLGRARPRRSAPSRPSASTGPIDRWRTLRRQIHDDVCDARLRRRARKFRPVLRFQSARREPAAHPHDGVPPCRRSARAQGPSPQSSATCCATDSCCATTRFAATTGCRLAKGHSSRAASGWLTRTSWRDAWRTRSSCSSACSSFATTSACSPSNTMAARAPARRQLPAGVLARRADQHGAQPGSRDQTGSSALRGAAAHRR